jgi:hypothetical protein
VEGGTKLTRRMALAITSFDLIAQLPPLQRRNPNPSLFCHCQHNSGLLIVPLDLDPVAHWR